MERDELSGTTRTRPVPWAGTTGTAKPVEGSGLDSNVAGAAAYGFGFVTGALFLLLDGDDDFVRFHAIQSMAVSFVVVATYALVGLTPRVLVAVPGIGEPAAAVARLGYPMLALAAVTLWLVLVSSAYVGDRVELPVVGAIAAVG